MPVRSKPVKRTKTRVTGVEVIPPETPKHLLSELKLYTSGTLKWSTVPLADLLELQFRLGSVEGAIEEAIRRKRNIVIQKTRGF